MPTLAIVGRPNVGKSTLFNRIVGRRRAIVGDEPGITRDRLYGEGDWNGRQFRVVDTGGIVPDDPDLIPSEIFRQARVALQEADAIVLIVDVRTELAAPDMELARLLQRLGKPLFLAVNKVDTPKLAPEAENFRTLGIRELYPISAEHSDGVAELLDAVLEVMPAGEDDRVAQPPPAVPGDAESLTPQAESPREPRETKIAIIGHPNVGKSTLLNRLTGADRAIVSPIPGTTRDAVDELVDHDGRLYRFIDTAGIRRKGKTELMAEKLSVIMARKHLEAADIALLVIDATEGVTALDANIAGYAHESGRSVIIIVNKWDLAGQAWRGSQARAAQVGATQKKWHGSLTREGKQSAQPRPDRTLFERQLRGALKFLDYAPLVFASAESGRGLEKIFPLIAEVAAERRKRIPTGEMNRFLKTVDFERAPVPVARRVRILYMTQAAVAPPTFVLFTDRDVKLHFSFERFLQNQLRRAFGFRGTPIWIKVRPRKSV